MEKGYRATMRWLHTWSGLIVGWLLFAIFVTGTSAYYRNEITLWMKPEFHKSQASQKTIEIAVNKAVQNAEKFNSVSVTLPNNRSNLISIRTQGPISTKKQNTKAINKTKKNNHLQRGEKTNNQKEVNTQKSIKKAEQKQQQKRKRRVPPTYYDASTGELIKDVTKTGGGNFLYRFHFELYSIPRDIARWIVGIATMSMLIAIVSGIIIHKRIFKDIFTFRPKNNPRGWMDAHILPAVAVLPFLIMITYSGLLLFTNTMMPWAMQAYYDNFRDYRQDIMKFYNGSNQNQKPNNNTEKSVKVDSRNNKVIINDAKRIISTNAINNIQKVTTNKAAYRIINTNSQRQIAFSKRIVNEKMKALKDLSISKEQLLLIISQTKNIWTDDIGSFTIKRDQKNNLLHVTLNSSENLSIFRGQKKSLLFDGKTAKLIKEVFPNQLDSVVLNTNSSFRALHEARFADSTIRFLFFICGIAGIIISATGLILWIEKRKKKNSYKKSFGFWLVEKLNIGTIMGIFIAIAIYFIANRLIPLDEASRRDLEISSFFIAWLISYIHAFIRDTSKAWKEQLIIAATLFIIIPILNAVTVFDSIAQIINRDSIFIYFDIFLVFTSLVFIFITYILNKKSKKGEE